MVRKHFYFSGRVQGVGFRFQASWAAKQLGLTGWVRNLPDGRVEMEVQGEPFEVEKMVELLKEAMYIRINKIDSADVPVKEGERKFRTEY
ncbi:MAG: acylphosphatase [Lachnospiraceae bacterium]|jgi:acylphosphatase|uniref:acylphosphatase n=1 Tax=Candidatus Merdisoma sp. JLR.KK006 TaxID=3112626 RepID=UPI002FEFB668|nr:acylphosphatase [Lachnospiraceae bacterium]